MLFICIRNVILKLRVTFWKLQCIRYFLRLQLLFADVLKKLFSTIRVSKGLDPDHDRCSVSPDPGPNCLAMLSADNKIGRYRGKEKVKLIILL